MSACGTKNARLGTWETGNVFPIFVGGDAGRRGRERDAVLAGVGWRSPGGLLRTATAASGPDDQHVPRQSRPAAAAVSHRRGAADIADPRSRRFRPGDLAADSAAVGECEQGSKDRNWLRT